MRASAGIRTRNLRFTRALLCRLSYRSKKREHHDFIVGGNMEWRRVRCSRKADGEIRTRNRLITNQLRCHCATSANGWGNRIRTCVCRSQIPMPFRLAIPHRDPSKAFTCIALYQASFISARMLRRSFRRSGHKNVGSCTLRRASKPIIEAIFRPPYKG